MIERNGGGAVVDVLALLVAERAADGRLLGLEGRRHSIDASDPPRPACCGHRRPRASNRAESISTMLAGFDVPKAPLADVAEGILDGIVEGLEEISPTRRPEHMSAIWLSDPKASSRFSGE